MIYAKATAYLIGWVFLAIVLLRVIVGPLWGSGTDLGLIAAPAAFAAGVLALGKLASILLRDLSKTLRIKDPE
ncbi:hypothetical protein [Caulobacter sp. 1776]|uniref:hypothetical protein n=1 Tax=Caulobacter sp. 1776 TaxID=3156420 RepID=UPI00339B85A5